MIHCGPQYVTSVFLELIWHEDMLSLFGNLIKIAEVAVSEALAAASSFDSGANVVLSGPFSTPPSCFGAGHICNSAAGEESTVDRPLRWQSR